MLIPYTKPHASPAQQVAHLRARGLSIRYPDVAARKIELIGYERLRVYFLSRRQVTLPGKPFVAGTSDQDIFRLYECDSALRDACFAAVGQFELMFRNAVSEELSTRFGSHPYYDVAAFRSPTANLEALQTFTMIYAKTKDARARHYRQIYSTPALPPIWTLKEFLTFGAASRVFQCFQGATRTAIALQFGIRKDTIFTQWIECLVDLRNMCAHHDRLFNRSFQKQPSSLTQPALPIAPRQKLKAILECLDYMTAQRGAPTNAVAEVQRIIARYPEVRPTEIGY